MERIGLIAINLIIKDGRRKGKFMNITDMPDKIYKEIIGKDGQRLVFDFSGLDKLKEIYAELTVNKYSEAKQKCTKRKNIRFWAAIAAFISLAIGTIFVCYGKALLAFLFISIPFILVFAIGNLEDQYADLLDYGQHLPEISPYMEAYMQDTDVRCIIDINNIYKVISAINEIGEQSLVKLDIDFNEPGRLILLYTDMSDNPHTLIFHTFNIKYKNIDHVGFTNNDNKLMIVLPLKYSKEYKELV